MSIFKRKPEISSCSCGGKCTPKDEQIKSNIKILGSGCKKCNLLEASTIEALRELGMNDKVEHVTDFAEIATYGVMSTPALVINDKVVSYGKVLSKEEVLEILSK